MTRKKSSGRVSTFFILGVLMLFGAIFVGGVSVPSFEKYSITNDTPVVAISPADQSQHGNLHIANIPFVTVTPQPETGCGADTTVPADGSCKCPDLSINCKTHQCGN